MRHFLGEFESRYSHIYSSLPIYLYDVRVFDWWNYHDKNKERIEFIQDIYEYNN